ncbi:hypothetical protein [Borreliella tanukii]|uniref:hypothetical protein n=1 Tax=Borreliella tanukii TaxID=56146 RepID=UPI003AB935CF
MIGGLKKLGSEAYSKVKEELMQADEPQGQVQEQVGQDVNNENHKNQKVEELEKKLEDLKNKIEGADGDKTTLRTYSGYEEELEKLEKELEDNLKDKKEDKEKLEKELKELEKTLKDKKEKRKKALKDAKKKFKGYKRQVDSATGETYGAQVGNQRGGGQQAWKEAKNLGLNVSYSNDTDTSDMSSGIIEGALKKIEEELNNSIEDFGEDKKE